LNLDNAALMILALAAWMGDLSGSSNPRVAVAPILELGLPDHLTRGVALAVFDARNTRGDARGVSGRMLRAAETYRALVSSAGPALPPPEALSRMCSGGVPGVDGAVARAFSIYKGSMPLGSRLVLPDSSQALVVGRDEQGWPILSLLVAGRLGARAPLPRGVTPRVLGGPLR